MTVEKWREVLSCYQAAIDMPSDRRREFLESTARDPEVLEKVLRMVKALEDGKGELTAGSPAIESVPRTGTTVGRYDVVAPLGQGGMGEVYFGWDSALDRAVALKFLRPERSGVPAAAAGFISEAKAASALNHPNIVTVHEVLQTRDSRVIVMELVEGQSGRELCTAPFPLSTVLNVGRQMALALAAAHANGIVHRDVKPENIMVRADGYVKLLDFGLARRISVDGSTTGGLPAGTLRYMSPEQIRGKTLTPATDIFSLGLVLYELATGSHPFAQCSTLDGAVAIVSQPVPDPTLTNPLLPARLASLIGAMLSQEPSRRPRATEVGSALRAIEDSFSIGLASSPVAAQQNGLLKKPAVWLGLVIGLLGLTVLAGSFWRSQRPSRLTQLTSRPLTSQPGWEESPSFSPDGSAIAFTWAPSLNQPRQIYVKRLDMDAPVPLTRSDPKGLVGSLAWSPDGSRVAFKVDFHSDGGLGAIYTIPKQGGKEVKLVDLSISNFSSSMSWSPDGTRVAFSDAVPGTGRLAIYTFNAETGEKRKLTTPPVEDWGDWDPTFSPDGRTLAFKRVRGYWLDAVYLMPAAGGPIRRITKDSAGIWGHAWMPKGDGLIVSTQRGGSVFGLWRFPLTPGPEPGPITGGGLDAITPTSSRKIGRIAWVNRLEDTNIYRTLLTGAGSSTELISSTRRDDDPCYSQDGRIAFASDRSGSWEIWIARPDGSDQVRVTNFGGPRLGGPRWSPDGRRLAFGAQAFGRGTVFVLECQLGTSRCGEPKPLAIWPYAGTASEGLPSWSGDGSYLYFVSNRTARNEIWRQALAGGAAAQVTQNGGYWSNESPDGKWLYFVKFQPKGIWRMPGSRPEATAVSGEEQLLIGPPLDVVATGWTITPEEILFVSRPDKSELRVIQGYSLASGKIRTIMALSQIPERGIGLSVSPDSRYLLYGQLDRSGSNIMIGEHGL